jgi:TolB-like protein
VQTARDIYNELRHVQKQLESGSRPKPGSGSARAAVVDSLWLAVLPFTTRGADEDARTLADGLTEDITAGLARFPYLSVVAEHSARQHKDTTADVRQIGRVLGARYILDGGVRRGGTSIRITARLVDAGSGAQLWSETYTREPAQGNLLAVQDNVTDRLVATVADVHGVLLRSASAGVRGIPIEQLTPEELRLRYDRDGSVDTFAIQDEIGDRVAATLADEGGALYRLFAAAVKATTDAEHDALRLFVRFAEFVEHFTREQHGRLRDEYQALVEHQPLNATAWAHLAILYGLEVFFGFNPLPDPVATHSPTLSRGFDARPNEPSQLTARTRGRGTHWQMPPSSSATPLRFAPPPTARSSSTRSTAGRSERLASCAHSPVIQPKVLRSSPGDLAQSTTSGLVSPRTLPRRLPTG